MDFEGIDKTAVLVAALAGTLFSAFYHWGLQRVWLYAWRLRVEAQKEDRAQEEEARRKGHWLHPTNAERAGRSFGCPPTETPDKVPAMMDGMIPFFTAAVCHLLIAGLIAVMAGPDPDLFAGVRTATLAWMGFAVPFLAIAQSFSHHGPAPVAPQAMHRLGALLTHGIVIGSW